MRSHGCSSCWQMNGLSVPQTSDPLHLSRDHKTHSLPPTSIASHWSIFSKDERNKEMRQQKTLTVDRGRTSQDNAVGSYETGDAPHEARERVVRSVWPTYDDGIEARPRAVVVKHQRPVVCFFTPESHQHARHRNTGTHALPENSCIRHPKHTNWATGRSWSSCRQTMSYCKGQRSVNNAMSLSSSLYWHLDISILSLVPRWLYEYCVDCVYSRITTLRVLCCPTLRRSLWQLWLFTSSLCCVIQTTVSFHLHEDDSIYPMQHSVSYRSFSIHISHLVPDSGEQTNCFIMCDVRKSNKFPC